MTEALTPGWVPREPPLAPVAVLAHGRTARALAVATVARIDAGAVLRVAAAPGWILILGAANDLPWVDGVTYLGDDDGLLVPTTEAPDIPADVLRRAIARRVPQESTVLVAVGNDVLSAPRPVRPADPQAVMAAMP